MKRKLVPMIKKINDLEETVNNKDSEISELKAEISNLQAELAEAKKAKDVVPVTSAIPLSSSRANIKPQIKNIGSSKVEPTQAKNTTDFNSPYKSEVGNLPSWKLREMEKKKRRRS